MPALHRRCHRTGISGPTDPSKHFVGIDTRLATVANGQTGVIGVSHNPVVTVGRVLRDGRVLPKFVGTYHDAADVRMFPGFYRRPSHPPPK